MIAAVRRRVGAVPGAISSGATKWTRRADRLASRGLERAHPTVLRAGNWLTTTAKQGWIWAWPRLRPVLALCFRGLAVADRRLHQAGAAAARGATVLSSMVTPRRAIAAVIVAAGIGLVLSQFIDYRGVEIGQAAYAGLPDVAKPPTTDIRTAGQAHSYLLVPLGLLCVLIGIQALRRDRRRLGLTAAGLGLLSVVLILIVDLPNGLDAGSQTSRFSGATAVLQDGFYAELAAAGGLVLAGLLYYARPCRIRINLSGRAASARRRRPQRQDSSPARVARRA